MSLSIAQRTHSTRKSTLDRWIREAIALPDGRVKVRVRGNNLHVLCEAPQCPDATSVVTKLESAIAAADLDTLLPPDQPPIYKVSIYGRVQGPNYPDWTQVLDLDRDGLEERGNSAISDDQTPEPANPQLPPSTELTVVSHRKLASQGNPRAIAHYLSETLSPLGVGVEVQLRTKNIPQSPKQTKTTSQSESIYRRLYVLCASNYSPDPSLLAPTIAEKLRDLQLQGFRDAVIVSQVTGEAKPDWRLLVDLTPCEVMLQEWGRWGDILAICRLLDRALASWEVKVSAVLKESTLHLFCTAATELDKLTVRHAIEDLLFSLTPQGIAAATIYGHLRDRATPLWVDWIDLPSMLDSNKVVPTPALARQGDREALAFLLNRLLNPDLNQQLMTGGTRIQLLQKKDLLHVMCDAPVCPEQAAIALPIARFLRQLNVPNLAGVRVYGRMSGQKLPRWNYGVDFAPRQRLVPEATPEFTASSAYVGELISKTSDGVLEGAGEPSEELEMTLDRLPDQLVRALQHCLIWSGLFVPNLEMSAVTSLASQKAFSFQNQRLKTGTAQFLADKSQLLTGLIWGTLGLLLALQVDLVLGNVVQSPTTAEWGYEASTDGLNGTAEMPPSSPYPTFNNEFLDEHLGRYHQFLQESGPPDVLIVGSSRALRGINPAGLREALATQGYANVSVYNFGVNGATAKVVHLIVGRILTAPQLPKLILWADGTRAFNSGREDLTYRAIVSSPGYQQLMAGTLIRPDYGNVGLEDPLESFGENRPVSLIERYQRVNRWLDGVLGSLSAIHPRRDRLQELVSERLADFLPKTKRDVAATSEAIAEPGIVNSDGFLPFSIRFNPIAYYQNHVRVSGEHDRDYDAFELEGEQADALQSIVELTKKQRIPLIFVNMPLTRDYLDPVRAEYERQFQRYMLGLAVRTGFTFRDITMLWDGFGHDYFSDPSHLNRYGADVVSEHLARDPIIPWSAVINASSTVD